MEVMLMTFAALMFVVIAMSVGVLLGRKPIKGSCGGMSALGMDTACDICGGKPSECDSENPQVKSRGANAELAYEAK